jgi:hypothetical protein
MSHPETFSKPGAPLRWTAALLCCALGPAAGAPAPLHGQAALPRGLIFHSAIPGTEELELRWPVAVAAGSANEIAVGDVHGKRLVIVRRSALAWSPEREIVLPAAPVAVAWDGSRYLVSVRQPGPLVTIEGAERRIGRLPLPEGAVAGALAAAGGELLVYDSGAGAVLRLSAAGSVRQRVPVAGRVTGLAAGVGGGFFAAVGERGVVLRYNAAGQLESTWAVPGVAPVPAWPAGLAAEPGGTLFVADRHGHRIVALDATGQPLAAGARKGWEEGLVLFPAALALLGDGSLAVADEGNGRLQIFTRARGGS